MIPRGKDLVTTFAECLNHACRLAAATRTREAAIAVHTKHNVHGAIESVLGPRATNQLLAGNVVISGVRFHLITERIKSKLVRGPLIAAYVSPRFLDILLDDKRACHLIFLPWNPQEETAFFAEHRPEILSPPPGWTLPACNPTRTTLTLPSSEARAVRESLGMTITLQARMRRILRVSI
jgi:hypothetical protein